jgi:protein phosphatase
MSRYLWAIGESAIAYKTGEVLADRYLCKGPRIFLDTKPALLPGNLDEIPDICIPYLKLSPHQLHIPQIYDWIQFSAGTSQPMLLVEQAPLYQPKVLSKRGIKAVTGHPTAEVELLPALEAIWPSASALRQLHWLWQIANLWYPMQAEGVASSLLTADLLRVEGPILRLRELQFDQSATPLAALGDAWLPLSATAQPEVQAPLQQLCHDLVAETIRSDEALIAELDETIARLDATLQTRTIQISTLSDQGPSRQRNEDACYPPSGTTETVPPAAPLVIVCDGIGGHQGGDVASHLAIETLEQRVKSLEPDQLSAAALEVELEKAVGAANDLISQQNDQEQRFDRQRMGTTVVMGLVRLHELYITHVGDSRAYWITPWGCHQVTQDDDVASREVRLGYSSYVQALQQPSAGSLVQALGMGSAANLYPTVQRFILDDDGVFLLCSDGLSDNDQVEQHWARVILPLLTGKADLATVSQQLIHLANTHNGYDNSTIAIIHCRVARANSTSAQPTQPATTRLQNRTRAVAPTAAVTQRATPSSTQTTLPPTAVPTQRIDIKPAKSSGQLPLVAAIIALSTLAAAIVGAIVWFRSFPVGTSQVNSSPSSSAPSNSPSATASASPSPTEESVASAEPLQVNSDILVASNLAQYNQAALDRRIPEGSMVYEAARKSFVGETWVQLKVCAFPAPAVAPESPSSSPAPSSPPAGVTSSNGELGVGKATTSASPRDLALGELGWIDGERYRTAIDTNDLSVATTPAPNCVRADETAPGNTAEPNRSPDADINPDAIEPSPQTNSGASPSPTVQDEIELPPPP